MNRSPIIVALILLLCAANSVQAYAGDIYEQKPKDEWLSEDKLLHALTSAYLVGFTYTAYHGEFDNSPQDSRLFAVSTTTVAGIGKELYDMRHPDHTASWKDLAADAAGIALGILLFTFID